MIKLSIEDQLEQEMSGSWNDEDKKAGGTPVLDKYIKMFGLDNHYGTAWQEIAVPLHWWLSHSHGGQASPEYAALGKSVFSPGMTSEDDMSGSEQEIYDSLNSEDAVALADEISRITHEEIQPTRY